jgi:hypothetical protein
MRATAKELQSFYQFAEQRLGNGGCDQSLDELLLEWRACNPTSDELDENVIAVQASLRDMDNGETGRPIAEFLTEFRRRNGI